MKKILLILSILFTLNSYGQAGSSSSQSFPGMISMPVLQTVKAEILDESPVTFDTPEEIENGKLLKSYCRITVISNVPWVVSIRNNSSGNAESAGKPDPVEGIVSVKSSASNTFVPLAYQSIELFKSSSNTVVTTFYVDVRVKPSVITKDGRYGINLFFSVSPR